MAHLAGGGYLTPAKISTAIRFVRLPRRSFTSELEPKSLILCYSYVQARSACIPLLLLAHVAGAARASIGTSFRSLVHFLCGGYVTAGFAYFDADTVGVLGGLGVGWPHRVARWLAGITPHRVVRWPAGLWPHRVARWPAGYRRIALLAGLPVMAASLRREFLWKVLHLYDYDIFLLRFDLWKGCCIWKP